MKLNRPKMHSSIERCSKPLVFVFPHSNLNIFLLFCFLSYYGFSRLVVEDTRVVGDELHLSRSWRLH